mgnify:CR=1 FL=1
MACRDRCVVFMSTFACFFTRAFDNFRMGIISQTNINVAGSHCGISIGEDGPSQMALEDIAMFRTLPGATVFYPRYLLNEMGHDSTSKMDINI